MNTTTWDIVEKTRKAYLDMHYQQVVPVADNLTTIVAFSSEQSKLFDGTIKKFETVSKKMGEAEAKLQSLGEMSGKLALTNNDPNLAALNTDIKSQLDSIKKTSDNRELTRIFLKVVNLKASDDLSKSLLQNVANLKTDTDKNAKTIEGKVKDTLKELTDDSVKIAKETTEAAKKGIQPAQLNVPDEAKYKEMIDFIQTQVES